MMHKRFSHTDYFSGKRLPSAELSNLQSQVEPLGAEITEITSRDASSVALYQVRFSATGTSDYRDQVADERAEAAAGLRAFADAARGMAKTDWSEVVQHCKKAGLTLVVSKTPPPANNL